MSGGLVMAVNDPVAGAGYLDTCAGGLVPTDVSAAWADRAHGLIQWLHTIDPGLQMTRIGGAEHMDLTGSEAIDVYQPGGATSRLDPRGKAGSFLFEKLSAAAVAHGAQVLWETPAVRLLRDESTRTIQGVAAQDAAGSICLKQSKAKDVTGFHYVFHNRSTNVAGIISGCATHDARKGTRRLLERVDTDRFTDQRFTKGFAARKHP